ncbi:hypothetical protein [Actinokineospora iranica]|uniref:hypothetical protein n=1 Tax=Actinokineospora iranica TaxID=1271860 RepID=UPI001E50DA93|nr:hypothetical protein [Actinokineospora iranica]
MPLSPKTALTCGKTPTIDHQPSTVGTSGQFSWPRGPPTDRLVSATARHIAPVRGGGSRVRAGAERAGPAGGEYGVAFADVLSAALGVPTNGTARSHMRRDKAAMVEAVTAAGLRGQQSRTADAAELAAWHRALGGRIVVKPSRSAGGDGVSFATYRNRRWPRCGRSPPGRTCSPGSARPRWSSPQWTTRPAIRRRAALGGT